MFSVFVNSGRPQVVLGTSAVASDDFLWWNYADTVVSSPRAACCCCCRCPLWSGGGSIRGLRALPKRARRQSHIIVGVQSDHTSSKYAGRHNLEKRASVIVVSRRTNRPTGATGAGIIDCRQRTRGVRAAPPAPHGLRRVP